MSEPNATVILGSAAKSVQHLELTSVDFYEVRGTRLETDSPPAQLEDPGEGTMDMEMAHRTRPNGVDIRCRLTITAGGVEVLVDAAAVFLATTDVTFEDGVIDEFSEKVGIMAVYPYLRQAATDAAGRFQVQCVLPLLKREQVTAKA